jgi:anti-sigma B factor antagonist
MELTMKGREAAVVMDSAFTIYEAKEAKALLLDALSRGQHLEVDLTRVVRMDTAGLQLLILLKREASRAGKSMRITGHSQASIRVLDSYDLGSYFGDPVVLPSAGAGRASGAQ